MITRENYFDWTKKNALPVDDDIKRGDELIRLLTKEGKSWKAVDDDSLYSELVKNHLAILNSLVEAHKKPVTPAQKKRAASVRKKGAGAKKVRSTAKADGASFAEKMRKVREAKQAKTEQSSDSSSKKGAGQSTKKASTAKSTKQSTAKPKPKFKAGQWVMESFTKNNRVGQIVKPAYLKDNVNNPGWWYQLKEVGGQNLGLQYPENYLQATSKPEKVQAGPKLKAEDQAYLNAKHVKVPSVELKHIKKFVSLTGEGTKEKIVDALKTLQREIKKGVLGKKSPVAAELDEIQDTYLDILNKGKAPYKVQLSEDKLAHYVGLAGGEKVYKTVEILLKFIGWSEESKTEVQIKKLLSEIKNAKAKGKIKSTDPYAGEVDELASMLSKAGSGKKFDAEKVDLQGISSLSGLGCACSTMTGLAGLPRPISGGVMSASQVMTYDYPTYEFSGQWGQLLGRPQTNGSMMIWGEPGQGKSTMAYQLARYLASQFGTVLYVAQEEINQAGQASMTVQTKLKSVGGPVEGWRFTGDWKKIDGKDKFAFIDSVNSSGLTQEDFEKLKAKYPHVFFVLIFQATKDGKFKGTKDWEHLVDIVAKVESGQASTTKNRFAALSTTRIF